MEWPNEEWQQEEEINNNHNDDDMHATIDVLDHNHHAGSSFHTPVALDRRSTAGSSSTKSFGSNSFRHGHAPTSPSPPPHVQYNNAQSSPSVVSSLNYSSAPGGWSPLYRQPSSQNQQQQEQQQQSPIARDTRNTRSSSSSSNSRNELARRLTLLAQRLTCGDDIDELALTGQLEEMEKAVSPPSSPNPRRRQLPQSPPQQQQHSPAGGRSDPQSPHSPQSPPPRSDYGSVLGSPVSLIRSQFSNLSLTSLREREQRERERIMAEEQAEHEAASHPPPGISEAHAKQLISETDQLNEQLCQVAANLRARQEEMEHINNLLVERTERAAERIVFLQKRVSYLEHELDENDDELQHLRICLKAVEIQMPPNPDHELQRCINVFKNDFRTLKHKRASRTVSGGGGGGPNAVASSPGMTTSPLQTPVAAAVAASAPTTPSPAGAKKQRSSSYRLYT